MKYLAFLLLLIPAIGNSASYVFCDPSDGDVAGRVRGYRKSAGQYTVPAGLTQIRNPDVSALLSAGVRWQEWKCTGSPFDTVIEMTQADKDALTATTATLNTANARVLAKAILDQALADNSMILRAVVEIIRDEINLLRAEHSLAARTNAQIKTAIQNKVDSGDVD